MKLRLKRILSAVLALCLLISCGPSLTLPASAAGNGDCGDRLTWYLNDYGVLTISGVGDMWSDAFGGSDFDKSAVTAVVIENGVTDIGDYAFYGFENLSTVSIGNSVARIGWQAFGGCGKLTSVTVPGSVSYISGYAFSDCTNLSQVTLPASVTEIGSGAFEYCIAMKSVTFLGAAPYIDWTAFNYVTTTVYYPMEQESWLEYGAKRNYGGTLTWVPTNGGVADYNIVDSGRCGDRVTWTLDAAGKLTVSGVGEIWSDPFSDSDEIDKNAIKSVVIENGITGIGSSAFYYCINLTSVTIAESVTWIGYGAFEQCSSLKTINIPETVTSIESHTFADCTSLESIVIPGSVTNIYDAAFEYCTALKSITFLGAAPWIDWVAFNYVDATAYYPYEDMSWWQGYVNDPHAYGGTLTWVPVKDSVPQEHILDVGVCGDQLTWVLTRDGVLTISGTGWMDSSPWRDWHMNVITAVVIEEGVNNIADYAFEDCGNLKTVSIPSTVDGIGSYAFSDCTSLTEIVIPAGVANIYGYAFECCTSLKSITFLGATPWIDWLAFNYVDATAYYPYEDMSWWNSDTKQDYGGTITWVPVKDGVPQEQVLDLGMCGSDLTWVLTRDGTLTISGTGRMDSSPWRDRYWDRITTVVIEEGVSSIAGGAFENCYNMAAVSIPSTVTEIDAGAFANCTSLGSVVIPDGVTHINGSAFSGCANLNSVILGRTVEFLGDWAFLNCTNLESITFTGKAPVFAYGDEFTGVTANVYYPMEDLSWWDSYIQQNSFGGTITWIPVKDGVAQEQVLELGHCGEHLTWILTSDGVLTISGTGYMDRCPWNNMHREDITTVVIGEGVVNVVSCAFLDCTNLTEVSVPGTVTEVGDWAFSNCPALKTVIFTGSAPSFCYDSFDNTTTTVYYPMENSTWWNGGPKQDYYGTVTWIPVKDGVPQMHIMDLGTWGDNITWILDKDGVLTLSGSGAMRIIPEYERPWYYSTDKVVSLVIDERITTIASDAFSYFDNLTSVTIPAGITSIGNWAFYGCYNLVSITFKGGAPVIGDSAFGNVTATVYYTADGETWTKEKLQNYGGSLTWSCLHVFGEWIQTKAPTCTENGTKKRTCLCGAVDSVILPALGHDHKATATQPTCTEQGFTTHTCIRCGDSYKDTYVAAMGHDYKAVVTLPTCTEKGYTTHTCAACGHSYVDSYVNAKGHSFGAWTQTKAPTCTENGTEVRSCAVCGTSQTREIAALSHSYEAVVTQPTCTEGGFTTHTCSRCADSYVDSYVSATGHSFGAWTQIKAPTCTADGSEKRTCHCGHSETRVVSKLGHDYKAVVTAPTCTEDGFTTHTCSRCADSYVDSYVDALGHKYVSVVTPPTAEAQGYTTHTCANCGNSYVDSYTAPTGHNAQLQNQQAATCTESGYTGDWICTDCGKVVEKGQVILASGHSYGAWTQLSAPTCTAEGSEKRVCHCGHSETRTLNKLGHDYEAVITEPTCVDKGYITYTCTRCDDSYTDNYVDVTAHSFNQWTQTKAPSCTESGTEVRNCAACGLTQTREVNALGHDYEAVVIEVTCTGDGYTIYTCIRCDDSYEGDFEWATGHSFGAWTLVKPSTCTEFGEKQRSCIHCDYQETRSIRMHNWQAWELTKVATMTQNGEMVRHCADCDETETKIIEQPSIESMMKIAQAYSTCFKFSYWFWDVTTEQALRDFSALSPAYVVSFLNYVPNVESWGGIDLDEAQRTAKAIFGYTYDFENMGTVYGDGCMAYYDAAEQKVCFEIVGGAGGGSWYESVSYEQLSENQYRCYQQRVNEDGSRDDYWQVITLTLTEWGLWHIDSYERYTPCKEHSWGEWTTVHEATCTENGSQHRVCNTCGQGESRQIAALGHNYSKVIITEPTCTEMGYTTHICDRCSHSYTDSYQPYTGHSLGAWTLVMPSTCTEYGEKQRSCAKCDYQELDRIQMHNWQLWDVTKVTTMEQDGEMERHCADCGETEIKKIEKPTIQSLVDTASKYDIIFRSMNLCYWDVSIEDAFDDFSALSPAYVVSFLSSVLGKGSRAVFDLDEVQIYAEAIFGCTYDFENMGTVYGNGCLAYYDPIEKQVCFEMIGPVTGGIDGYECVDYERISDTQYVCYMLRFSSGEYVYGDWRLLVLTLSDCGLWHIDSYSEYIVHTWGEWVTTNAPTCTENGLQYRICDDCGEKESRQIAALGHSYIYAMATAPTENKEGSLVGTCTTCFGGSTVILPALNTQDYSYSVIKAPTYTEEGLGRYVWNVTDYGELSFDVVLEKPVDPVHGPHFVVSNVSAGVGETVNVTIALKNNPGIASIKLSVGYHEYLTLTNVVYNVVTEQGLGQGMRPVKPYNNPVVLNWFEGVENVNGDWVFVTLTFQVAEDIPSGELPIILSYEKDDVYNIDLENVTFGITQGHIYACNHEDFGPWIQVKAPSCTENGLEQRTCTCGKTESRDANALGHQYSDAVMAPTCTEKGYTIHTCTRCDDSFADTYVDALDHSFGQWMQIKAPTCTVDGSENRVCHCGHSETRAIDKLGHSYTAVVTAPTCTDKGYTTHTCARCDDSYIDSYVSAIGHSFGLWTEVKAPTCTADGSEERVCHCGHSEVRAISKLGHDYKAIVTAPTCTEQGYTTHTCHRCSDSYKDSYTDMIGHDYIYAVGKEPTKTAEGSLTGTCSACSDKSHVSMPALNTTDYGYSIIKNPSITEEGVGRYTWNLTSYGSFSIDVVIDKLIDLEHAPQIVVSSETALAGEQVKLTIALKNNPGVASLKLKLFFDNVLTLESVEYNSLIGGMSMKPESLTSPVTLNWFNGVSDITGDWVYVTLTFRVSETAKGDTTAAVSVTYSPDDIYNIAEENVPFVVINGGIKIKEFVSGDINGDGDVNNKDLTRLFQYLSDYKIDAQESALDVNGDGDVNNKDLTRLFQYLSGYNVKIY